MANDISSIIGDSLSARRSSNLTKNVVKNASQDLRNIRANIAKDDWETIGANASTSTAQAVQLFKDLLQELKEDQQRASTLKSSFETVKEMVKEQEGQEQSDALGATIEKAAAIFSNQSVFDQTKSYLLANMSKNLLARIHTEFNLTFKDPIEMNIEVVDILPGVKAKVEEFSKALKEAQKDIHSALAEGDNQEGAKAAAQTLINTFDAEIAGFVRLQANGLSVVGKLKEAGKNSNAEKLGKYLAQANQLTREAIGSILAAYDVMYEIQRGASSSKVKSVIENASKLSLKDKTPDGKNTTLKNLSKAKDGDLIEIEGIIVSIETGKDSDKKLISKVTIEDPSSGDKGTGVAIYSHLGNIGLAPGGYCVLDGKYEKSSNFNGGNPALVIDELALEKEGKTSWRIAFLNLAAPWFSVWAGNLNMQWTLSPHQNPTSEEKPSSFGAGELVFTPLIRQ